MDKKQEIQMCECCGLRPGVINSRYLFNSPLSDPEADPGCGDWVCAQCEIEAQSDDIDDVDFGPCCACEGFVLVRNIMMLDKKGLVPGTGWGCVVCHIPFDGASAVICDRCLETKAEIRFAVYGYITYKQRVKIEELTEPFAHDMKFHQADLNLSDEYIDEFED